MVKILLFSPQKDHSLFKDPEESDMTWRLNNNIDRIPDQYLYS